MKSSKSKLIKKPSNNLPTPDEMKAFAESFELDAWTLCCTDPLFLNLVSENINKAAARAFDLLSKENNI